MFLWRRRRRRHFWFVPASTLSQPAAMWYVALLPPWPCQRGTLLEGLLVLNRVVSTVACWATQLLCPQHLGECICICVLLKFTFRYKIYFC